MLDHVKAVSREGVFVPESACDLPENTRVDLFLRIGNCIPPRVTDPEERARLLQQVTRSMQDEPIPEGAPRFTREQLHERR